MSEPLWVWILLYHPRRLIIELDHRRALRRIRRMTSKHLVYILEQGETFTYLLRKGLF
ncbi:hypothetical protein ES702_01822 [subsurface metagenome]